MRAIFRSADDAIFARDRNGRIIAWNQAARRLYGYTVREAIGRHVSMLIPPNRQGEPDNVLRRVSAGRRIENLETVRLAKGGRLVNVSLTISPIRDSRGRVVGISTISRDVSRQHRLDAEVLRAGEQARGQIRHDMHESLGQNLAGAAYLVRVLQQQLQSRRMLDEAATAGEVIRIINAAIRQTRSLAKELQPVPIGGGGLEEALHDLATGTAAAWGAACKCSVAPTLAGATMDGVKAVHLYHIAREAVLDAVEQDKALRIEIDLAEQNGAVVLRVRGRNCPPSLKPKSHARRSLRSQIMTYRAGRIGAALDIKTCPGGAHEVTCRVPHPPT